MPIERLECLLRRGEHKVWELRLDRRALNIGSKTNKWGALKTIREPGRRPLCPVHPSTSPPTAYHVLAARRPPLLCGPRPGRPLRHLWRYRHPRR